MSPFVLARVAAALSARPAPEEPEQAPAAPPKPMPEWKRKGKTELEMLRKKVKTSFKRKKQRARREDLR